MLAILAEACNELVGPISASLRPGNTASIEEISRSVRSRCNIVSDLTGPRFEPRTTRSKDERVKPLDRLAVKHNEKSNAFQTQTFPKIDLIDSLQP